MQEPTEVQTLWEDLESFRQEGGRPILNGASFKDRTATNRKIIGTTTDPRPVVFDGCNFKDCVIKLGGVTFFHACKMDGVTLEGGMRVMVNACTFKSCRLLVHFLVIDPDSVQRTMVDLRFAYRRGAACERGIFVRCEISQAKITGDFCGIYMSDCTIRNAEVAGSMHNVLFERCGFKGANSFGHKIWGTSFVDVVFSSGTRFNDVSISDCAISKTSLWTLGKDRGGLTQADLLGFTTIIDPIGDIRREFSGYKRYMHWFSLAGFLVPYASFVTYKWLQHLLRPEDEGAYLLTQLARYIWSGGQVHTEWRFNAAAVLPFIVYATYLSVRMLLYFKLCSIEADELAREGPSPMDVSTGGWRFALWFVKSGAIVIILLAIWNMLVYGFTPVPE